MVTTPFYFIFKKNYLSFALSLRRLR